MRVPRKNPELNDYLEVLDEKFAKARSAASKTTPDSEIVPRALEL